MSDNKSVDKSVLAKDTVVYMIAKAIEGILGILTISMLTHLFLDSEYGMYAKVNIAVTTLAMVCIQWLLQSVVRYVNQFEVDKKDGEFYSTAFFSWLRMNIIIVIVASVFVIITCLLAPTVEFFGDFLNEYPLSILILAICMFVSYNTSQLMVSLLAAKRRIKLNLSLSLVMAFGKLVLVYIFVKLFGSSIEFIILSSIVLDVFVSITAFLRLEIFKYIGKANKSKETFEKFARYGTPLIGNLIATTVLNNSDRYIISYFKGDSAVGKYHTSYSVVSAAFTMIQTAIMRGSYPSILRAHSEGNTNLTQQLISQAVRNYLLISLPAVVGIGTLAEPLANLLFEAQYVSGYVVMFWVALGMMFLGLTEYSNKHWELSANTKIIFRNSLIGGIVNVGLNIALMDSVGYVMAAYSTFIGFLVYFLFSKIESRKHIRWKIPVKTYASIIGSAILMGAGILLLTHLLPPSKIMLLVYVAAGVIIYFACLSLTGEIKEEKAQITKFVRSKLKKPKNL